MNEHLALITKALKRHTASNPAHVPLCRLHGSDTTAKPTQGSRKHGPMAPNGLEAPMHSTQTASMAC